MDEIIIRKVWKANKQNQLIITIPKDKGIVEGDYVKIKKLKRDDET